MTVINTVYVLFNTNRSKIYIGKTTDLQKRLKRHNHQLPTKKTSYTSRNSGQWIVVYNEIFKDSQDATKRERWLKSGVGREYIKRNLSKWIISKSERQMVSD